MAAELSLRLDVLVQSEEDRGVVLALTVAAGESPLAPALTRRLIERYVKHPPTDAIRRERFGELTDRELEVVQLLTHGLSNAEIGDRLYLSEATVETHVTRVLQKLGVRDRVQAVVLAYERPTLAVLAQSRVVSASMATVIARMSEASSPAATSTP
jgi:DNA-binding NarL/FixJ family response regulator